MTGRRHDIEGSAIRSTQRVGEFPAISSVSIRGSDWLAYVLTRSGTFDNATVGCLSTEVWPGIRFAGLGPHSEPRERLGTLIGAIGISVEDCDPQIVVDVSSDRSVGG